MTLDDIDRQIRLIQKKIRMFQETGDLKRLSRLKVKLAVLQVDLKRWKMHGLDSGSRMRMRRG